MSEEINQPRTALESTAQQKLLTMLGKHKRQIDAVLGKVLDPKRFAWLVVNSIRQNPALAGCSPASFLNSVMLATQLGVEIRRDSSYLVPFGRECQLLIDYKAKIGLARRSGQVGGIQAVTVRERDDFEWKYTTAGVQFHHRPAREGERVSSPEERGRIVGVYAFAQLKDGGVQFREPMSLAEIDRIRKRSRAGVPTMTLDEIFAAHDLTPDGKQAIWQTWEYKDKRRQPWVTDFEAMALKSVTHSLCKSLPLTWEGQLSQEVDEGFEAGKQPSPLADAIDIDPVDEQPMVEQMDKEEFQQYKQGRIDEAKAALAKKKGRELTEEEMREQEKALGVV